jgi:hypothetical protein
MIYPSMTTAELNRMMLRLYDRALQVYAEKRREYFAVYDTESGRYCFVRALESKHRTLTPREARVIGQWLRDELGAELREVIL